ncbi:carbohydrate deacetylase [Parabacteroides sp. FAFU027]|uniref:carbohydrate deacetylase n=1 Tax=Parabacteroides sp. FAFU027 TaxID=2922715 RepID=UPI001FAE861E|nr:ChbG/HpnK family deacetylase [Parabacteroides sp. FAFU027]
MKLIVNADDFGFSADVNQAITTVIKQQACSNTTLMVNMPATDEAVGLSVLNGFSDRIGLHLNLTDGFPLTDPIRGQKLFCDSDGNFNTGFHRGIHRFYLNKKEEDAVRLEFSAQIEKYLSYGFDLKHIDSHHHIHTNYSIFKILIPLLRKYEINSIRLTRNMFEEVSWGKNIYKRLLNNKIRQIAVTSNYLGSISDFEKYRHRIPETSIVEIAVHPVLSEEGILDMDVPYSKVVDAIRGEELISYRNIW